MDGILLSEFLGKRYAQLVKVGKGILNDLRAGCATEEKGSFGVLGGFGSFFILGTFAARIARFSRNISLAFN